jgi:hypothetical protein
LGRIQMSTDEYVWQQGWSCTEQSCVPLHQRTAVVTLAVTGASLHIPDLRVVSPLPTHCHRRQLFFFSIPNHSSLPLAPPFPSPS